MAKVHGRGLCGQSGEVIFRLRKVKLEMVIEAACFERGFGTGFGMGLPSQPVTLTVEQLAELNRLLANMRHDINNNLSLIVAAGELIKHKPQVAERMMATIAEQPAKVTESLKKFSAAFEQALGITRP
jgi:hypothetical protein